jgi:creatinine amidohydrolase
MSHLSIMNWVDVEKKLARTDLGLIPVGAVEVYGPHMPQGTDGIVAEALCRKIAESVECLVAPLIPVGYSSMLQSFPGTLSVPASVVREYCKGIADSMFDFGIKRVLFINGHAGNVFPIDELCEELDRKDATRRLAQVDIWRYIQPFSADLLGSKKWKFGHAGEAMTAVMLHLHAEWVLMDRAVAADPAGEDDPLGLSRPYNYRDMAPSGVIGDARIATPKVGREIFEKTVEQIIRFIDSDEFAIKHIAKR